MKIVQIGATFVGAHEKIENAIHNYLKEQGHESYILYAYGNSKDSCIIKYENKLMNIIRRVMWKYIGKTPKAAIISTINMIKIIKKINPDVVHLHVLHHGYVDYVMLFNYLSKNKIPVVYTMHDMWAFTGGCYHYTNVNCDGFLNGCLNCPKKTIEIDCSQNKTSNYLKLKLNLFGNLEHISFVSVSEWVHGEIMKTELKKYPQYVILNSIDLSTFINIATDDYQTELKMFEMKDKFYIFGVASNWDDRKGIMRFFELAKILGNDYKIILAGNADDRMRETAPSNIEFIGLINDKRLLYALYGKSDIHISMSFEETFGLTFVEAAFCGTKSIGFDSTAIGQVIDRVKGFVIPGNDIQRMAGKVRELSSNRSMCKLSDEEKTEVIRFFSSERMAKEYYRVYLDVTKK